MMHLPLMPHLHGPALPPRPAVPESKRMANLPVDVKELPSSYEFVADLPGVSSSNIRVLVENGNVLTISGDRLHEETAEEARLVRLERFSGTFYRKFTLPSDAQIDDISAYCNDGVLTVTVPKIPPTRKEKSQSIQVKQIRPKL